MGFNAAADHVSQMIRYLHRRGHKIRLLAVAAHDGGASDTSDLAEVVDELLVIPNEQNRGAGDALYLLPVNFRWPHVCAWIEKQMQWADIIDCEFVEMAHLVPKRRCKPLIVVNHEAQTQTWLDYTRSAKRFSREKVLNTYRAFRALDLERSVLEEADCMLALSKEDADSLRDLNPSAHVRVFRIGVNLIEYSMLPPPPGQHHLTYVGYYGHRPNQDAARLLVKEILPRVSERYPDAGLTLAGSFPTEEIKSYASDRVRVTGRVSDLTPIYKDSDILVFPIVSGRGIRMKVIQAMALGRPVITTARGAFGLDVQKGAHLRIAETSDEFVEQICDLFSHPESASNMVAAAREHIARFDYDVIVDEFEAILAELVADARRRT
jgi:glycosyltransferase involved in cell wall biosynthesis